MVHEPDAVTTWWRRISLRAKVTGVTVAVLALGLVAAAWARCRSCATRSSGTSRPSCRRW
ncbi:hypothetical protein [Microbacterium sp. NIBRBAC000506063]|uniref:hypothetical protein n=1 Tax=Microbacterium sp. NIBRBAC000506063 TaxID=2734618 RepID=UPI001BB6665F|nr:hypothetical protein [Microbacterium sp. NIBRBAC000506063]QTV80010.1 hypothetical protein KAE78_02375 [Microbacterium sp. NIBRBAC000506063]